MIIKEGNMLIQVLVDNDFETKESVKDKYGIWICKGMYVIENLFAPNSQQRQGWITEVIDEENGLGKIRVQIVKKSGNFLDENSYYITELEPSINWCKALVNG